METNNRIKITNEILAACVLILIGSTVLGVGIGISVSKIWACTIIGSGSGFLVNAGIILKLYYQKPISVARDNLGESSTDFTI